MSQFNISDFLKIKNKKSNTSSLDFGISQPLNLDGGVDLSAIGGLSEFSPFINDIPIISQGQIIVLIRKMISQSSQANRAVEEIVSECLPDGTTKDIRLDLDELTLSKNIKDKIENEFQNVLNLLKFKRKGREFLKRFLIDGVLFSHLIVDIKNPNKGISEIQLIDPLYIRKVISENGIEEFRYTSIPFSDTSIDRFSIQSNYKVIDSLSVSHINSGTNDTTGTIPLSVFYRALKNWNTLSNAEDSMLINRMSRAGEKKVFYVGIGQMSPKKGGALVKEIKESQTKKLEYDPETGSFKDKNAAINLSENYFIPRSSDGKTTEINTLPGAENTDKIGDVEFFLKKFEKSLIIPFSRFDSENRNPFGTSRSEEINRDEVIFQGFLGNLKERFSNWILDTLVTHLLLKRIISNADVEEFKNSVSIDFPTLSKFKELNELELISVRTQSILGIMPLIDAGYFTREYVFKNILKLSDDEVLEALKNPTSDDKS